MIERILKAYRDRRKAQQTQDEYETETKNINSAYARVFKTQDGQIVLNHMVKMHMARAIAEQGDGLLDIGVKQGYSNHVSEIIQRMEYN